jgi:hypothetical protein
VLTPPNGRGPHIRQPAGAQPARRWRWAGA